MVLGINDIRSLVADPDLSLWEDLLSKRLTPAELDLLVRALGSIIGDHAVDSPRAQFWRDAYLASEFARLRSAELIEMLSPIRNERGQVNPDFQILLDGAWLRYETVEALNLGRRRSEEFREDRARGGGQVRHDHVPTKSELIEILNAVAVKKAGKAGKYADCHGLVIKLSTWALMAEDELTEAYTSGTAQAGDTFNEVWIVKSSEAHLVWNCGQQVFRSEGK